VEPKEDTISRGKEHIWERKTAPGSPTFSCTHDNCKPGSSTENSKVNQGLSVLKSSLEPVFKHRPPLPISPGYRYIESMNTRSTHILKHDTKHPFDQFATEMPNGFEVSFIQLERAMVHRGVYRPQGPSYSLCTANGLHLLYIIGKLSQGGIGDKLPLPDFILRSADGSLSLNVKGGPKSLHLLDTSQNQVGMVTMEDVSIDHGESQTLLYSMDPSLSSYGRTETHFMVSAHGVEGSVTHSEGFFEIEFPVDSDLTERLLVVLSTCF